MHDLLFQRQREWAGLPADQMPQVLTGYAQELGLDVERFRRDLDAHTYQAKVMEQYQEAVKMGLPGTPSFIVNGRMYPTDQWGISYQGISALIGLALLEPRLYSAPPAFQIDPTRQYVATIRTPKGDIGVELYAAQAPLNVNSFIFLARQGWYDGTTFFLVIPGFVVQAGDPTGTAAGTPASSATTKLATLNLMRQGSWASPTPAPIPAAASSSSHWLPARPGWALHHYREGGEGVRDSPGVAGAKPYRPDRPAGAPD